MNRFTNFISKIVMIFVLALMFGILSCGSAYAESNAEWTTYDDSDINITYLGENWWHGDAATYGCYGSMISNNSAPTENEKINFKFYGTKIQLVGTLYPMADKRNMSEIIKIDGVKYVFNLKSDGVSNYRRSSVVFEKKDLPLQNHSVEIYADISNGSNYVELDAVNIDSNGALKPYSSNTILNIEPEKNKIHLNEGVTANLTMDNIKDIAAEDVRIKYDSSKLQFLGVDEVEGIKLVKQPDSEPGELRFIIASKGEKNIVNAKKALLKLRFKGIAAGEALVDVIKGRVSDGIEMEDDLTDEQCGQATITIDENALKDVNNSGGFTLLDLGIDARHMGKDPKSDELAKYNTDVIANNAIDDADLLEIGKLMLENPDYKF